MSGGIEWRQSGVLGSGGRCLRAGMPVIALGESANEIRGATVVEFTDGKISRNSDYWDLATYMKQVGLTK